MKPSADQLLEEARALPVAERAIPALQLLDSVGEPEGEVERTWRDEVRRRIAAVDAGKTSLAPWSGARARIFARP
jgi:putative addiction module component (TIGR02574 family)